jgi:hypothetical protein
VHQSASLLGACQLQLYLLRAVGRVTAISRRRSRGLWCVWAHHVAAALVAMGGDWTGQGHPVPTIFYLTVCPTTLSREFCSVTLGHHVHGFGSEAGTRKPRSLPRVFIGRVTACGRGVWGWWR